MNNLPTQKIETKIEHLKYVLDRIGTPLSSWDYGLTGGTALEISLGYRRGNDVDVVTYDPQIFAFLNPDTSNISRLVNVTDFTPNNSMAFERANTLFNIICAGPLLNEQNGIHKIGNAKVYLESTQHIAHRKIFQRVGQLRLVDLYDIITIDMSDHSRLLQLAIEHRRSDILALGSPPQTFLNACNEQLNLTQKGLSTMPELYDIISNVISI